MEKSAKVMSVEPLLGFDKYHLFNPERSKSELMRYKRYIKEMVELAGLTSENSRLLADEILEFEIKIAKVLEDWNGDRYDENDNFGQWWSDETLQHYQKVVEYFIKQYTSNHVPVLGDNVTIDGNHTLKKSIADDGAIRGAYRAYQRFKSGSLKEKALPGLSEYTPDQLFFLSYAQSWCKNDANEGVGHYYFTGNKALIHFRVIGTLSNNDEFSKAWNCPVESPMNPLHKCKLW